MLNRNFINAAICNKSSNSTQNAKYRTLGGTLTGNTIAGESLLLQVNTVTTNKVGSGWSGGTTFTIGSGDTAATINDYCLETPINETDFTIKSGNLTIANSNWDNTYKVISQIWEYSGTDEIEIKEIGWVCNNSQTLYMFDRTILESPITVNNGDTFTIALTIGGKATVIVNSNAA